PSPQRVSTNDGQAEVAFPLWRQVTNLPPQFRRTSCHKGTSLVRSVLLRMPFWQVVSRDVLADVTQDAVPPCFTPSGDERQRPAYHLRTFFQGRSIVRTDKDSRFG